MRKSFLCFLIVFFLMGCGHVRTKEINGVSVTYFTYANGILHARSLADDDIGIIGCKISEFGMLDFSLANGLPLIVTDDGLKTLSHCDLPNLKNISIGFNSHISDDGLKAISNIETLEGITLHCSGAITDKGLSYLADLPNLKGLDLRGCPKLTDEGILYFKNHPTLTNLYLGQYNLSPAHRRNVVEKINGIRTKIDVKITSNAVDVLKANIALEIVRIAY